MRGRIRSLPQSVVDVIAAGEVVERPASVVKELVENALDAGARTIRVLLEDGGRALVRVEDDGEGMGAEDLALAFAPHATSKITSVEDLEAIATYGFRGEALASIGAVGEASIASRPRAAKEGLRVENRRGTLAPPAPAAHPQGTTVEVRSLFSGLPARRKFLRSPAAEAARATEVVVRFALARPDVAFHLLVDGKTVLQAPPNESARQRTARALGEERAASLLPVSLRHGGVSVEGFVAPPDLAEKGRPPQHLFVNGRAVSDRVVAHAVRAALEGLVTVQRQPAWVLSVTVPPLDVDVNVHPAKSEVRFRLPSSVHDAVERAVREAVLSKEPVPQVKGQEIERREGIREAIANYLEGRTDAQEERQRTSQQQQLGFARSEQPTLRSTAPVLQIRNSFLVYEAQDGIGVIDQHALHERVLLERLKRGESKEIQMLLVPEVLDVGPADAARAEANADLLRGAGLLVERSGPGRIAVQGIPRALANRPARAVAEAALRKLRDQPEGGHAHGLLEGVLESMACHAAVRAGDPLPEAEARALLAEGRDLESSGHCAHGRPTELLVPFAELEKRFRRRG